MLSMNQMGFAKRIASAGYLGTMARANAIEALLRGNQAQLRLVVTPG